MVTDSVLKIEDSDLKIAAMKEVNNRLKIDPKTYTDIYDEPSTFQEAWDHPDLFQRNRWREAI